MTLFLAIQILKMGTHGMRIKEGEPECEATIHDVNAPVCDFTSLVKLNSSTKASIGPVNKPRKPK